jgi:hypothetical protein
LLGFEQGLSKEKDPSEYQQSIGIITSRTELVTRQENKMARLAMAKIFPETA